MKEIAYALKSAIELDDGTGLHIGQCVQRLCDELGGKVDVSQMPSERAALYLVAMMLAK